MWFILFSLFGTILSLYSGNILYFYVFTVIGFILFLVIRSTPSEYMGFGKNIFGTTIVWVTVLIIYGLSLLMLIERFLIHSIF